MKAGAFHHIFDTLANLANRGLPPKRLDVAAGLAPAEVTPAEVTPAEVTPAEVTPAEVTPAEVTPAGFAIGTIFKTMWRTQIYTTYAKYASIIVGAREEMQV